MKKSLSFIIIILITALQVLIFGSSVSSAESAIRFQNKMLESEIRKIIKKPSGSIFRSDVANITELSLDAIDSNFEDSERGVSYNLEGIQYLTGLKKLKLENLYHINTLEPLKSLKGLEELSLSCSYFPDIKPVSNLTKLKWLNISSSKTGNLSFLSNLKDLEVLYADENNIKDIKVLSGLTKLTSIHISKNQISDLKPLEKLPKLEVLDAALNKISDTAPLGRIKSLRQLSLASNRNIGSLKPLSCLIDLKYLVVYETGISDLTPLKGMKKLECLWASYNNIVNIDVVSNLENLDTLRLSNNKIRNINALSKQNKIQELLLDKNPITSYAPITPYFHKLKGVDFDFPEYECERKAKELSTAGKYNEAIIMLDKALKTCPDYTSALFQKGYCLMELKKYKEAIELFKKTVTLDTEHSVAYNNIAWSLYCLGKYDEALPYIDKSLAINPKALYSMDTKGWILLKLRRYDESKAAFEYVKDRLDENNKNSFASSYLGCGIAYMEKGKFETAKSLNDHISEDFICAIVDFEEVLKIEPQNAQAYYYLACAHSHNKTLKESYDNLKKAIALDPSLKAQAKNDENLKNLRESQEYGLKS